MRENHALAQLRAGKPSIGLWLQTHSGNLARIISAQGLFDWLLLDMEHTPLDLSTTAMALAAIADVSGGRCTPLVRVAHGTMYQIKQALDSGAQGIVVPMITRRKKRRMRCALHAIHQRVSGGRAVFCRIMVLAPAATLNTSRMPIVKF